MHSVGHIRQVNNIEIFGKKYVNTRNLELFTEHEYYYEKQIKAFQNH